MSRFLGFIVLCVLVAGCGGDDTRTPTAAQEPTAGSGPGESGKTRCAGDGLSASIDTSSGAVTVDIRCGDVKVPGRFGDAVFVMDETPCVMLDVQPASGSPERRVVCGGDDPNGVIATPRDCIKQLELPTDDIVEEQEFSRLFECFNRTNAPESLVKTWSHVISPEH